jgi:hypothetical protein
MPTGKCSQLRVIGAKSIVIQRRMQKSWLYAKPPIDSVIGDCLVARWS